MRTFALLLLASPLVLATDTASDMRGMARITVGGATVSVAAHMQDMPDPAFFNRFHFVIYSDDPAVSLLLSKSKGAVRVSATSKGSMTVDAVEWGFLEFFPADHSIRKYFRDSAPGSEVRLQWVTVSRMAEGVEILIEEPR